MYAVEFETDLNDRFIEIKNYEKVANKHARVIILVSDPAPGIIKTSLAGELKKYAKPELMVNEKEIAWELVSRDKNTIS